MESGGALRNPSSIFVAPDGLFDQMCIIFIYFLQGNHVFFLGDDQKLDLIDIHRQGDFVLGPAVHVVQ